jgi:AbrB family looped-hinge helix DNA binding protein
MRRAQQPPYTATVTSKLQLTIPKQLANRYGLRPGDRVSISTDGRRIFVQPYRSLLKELEGSLQKKEEKHAP